MSLFGDEPLKDADVLKPKGEAHAPTEIKESWGSVLFGKGAPTRAIKTVAQTPARPAAAKVAAPQTLFSGKVGYGELTIYADGTFTIKRGIMAASERDVLVSIEIDMDSMRRKSMTGRGAAALMTGGLSLAASNNRGVAYLTVVGERLGVQTFEIRNPDGYILNNHRSAKAAGDAVIARRTAASTPAPPQAAPATTAPTPPTPAAVPSDLAAQIKSLADLHAAGALTDEEFSAAKARLLG